MSRAACPHPTEWPKARARARFTNNSAGSNLRGGARKLRAVEPAAGADFRSGAYALAYGDQRPAFPVGVPRAKRLQGAGLRLASRCCGLAARLAEAEGRGCMPPRDWPRPPRARLSHCRRSSGGRGGRTEGCGGWRAPGNMAAADLAQVPDVDIDPDGVFKYVLIRVRAAAPSEAPAGESKDIVRGYKWAEYHADIYDKVAGEMQKKGYDCECLGGGRISHQSQDKKIHVYGYSMGFGRAQHSVSTEKIKAKYPDYEVTWADDGY